MRVTVAIDSFKGSLSTFQAGKAAEKGIKNVFPDAEVKITPVADGGEGTVDAIIYANHGEYRELLVHNPLGNKIKASYGIIPHKKTAVIEMASAAGITLIDAPERNPLNTTTYGVGEMIRDAIINGYRKFIIGIGGSATNDGGVGMLQALGFEFLNSNGENIPLGAKGLKELTCIKNEKAIPELKECSFCIACDVKNVLCGSNGCSMIYGPQKGATPEMIKDMDSWLDKYAKLTKTINPDSDACIEGTGAAGGMGFAFLSYLNGKLQSGIELVMMETGLEKSIENSDIVITGEGRLDGQSYMGKVPIGVAKLAKKYNKIVIAFAGAVTKDAVICNQYGINAFFPILKSPCTLEDAMNIENASQNLTDSVTQVFNLIKMY